MAEQIIDPELLAKHPLSTINKLIIKAIDAKNAHGLVFVIANDTHQLIKYDRAIVWRIRKDKIKMLGISGHTTINPYSELHQSLSLIVKSIKDKETPQVIDKEKLSDFQDKWELHRSHNNASVLWLPIFHDKKLVLGLWLERWNITEKEVPDPRVMHLLNEYLLKGYGAAWHKHTTRFNLEHVKSHPHRKYWVVGFAVILLALSFVRLPLRVATPCEVVPKDPYIVTAPLEGVIQEVLVHPGEKVKKGQLIVHYDPRVPMRDLNVVEKEVEIAKAKLKHSETGGIRDPEALQDLEVNRLQLERAEVSLDFQKHRYDLLSLEAEVDGQVMMDNPDDWRGRPVQVGEKILTIIDASKTKVRMWVPVDDNIAIDTSKPVRVFLSVDPSSSYEAKLVFISNEVILSDTNVPSFIAEAEWDHQETSLKPGSKGTAVLTGESSSLFYFLARKPLSFVRKKFGV